MSVVYNYFVGSPPDIATKVTDLDTKITIDLDLQTGTYTSTVYNALAECVEVTFSAALNDFRLNILNNLTKLILFEEPYYEVYTVNFNAFNRRSPLVTNLPTVNHDGLSGYSVGSIVLINDGTIYMCTDNTTGAAIWGRIFHSETNMMTLAIEGSDGFLISSIVFDTVGTFIYRGSLVDGGISKILAVVSSSDGSATGEVRITDITNTNTIALAGFGPTSGIKEVLDLGTISNVPSGQAIFEVEIRRVNTIGTNSVSIYNIQLYRI